VVGACEEYTPNLAKGEQVKSPGVLYKHYSPRCETLLFTEEELEEAFTARAKAKLNEKRVLALCEEKYVALFEQAGIQTLNLGKTESEMAYRLYELLREAEKMCDVLVTIEPKDNGGVMTGVLNRLRKACKSTDIQH
jgi:hypothetical protein